MIKPDKNHTDAKQESSKRNELVNIIKDWVTDNKKIFWKYEVSCFYKTYTIRIINLPDPSVNDIRISSINQFPDNQQKKQLCSAIKKACSKVKLLPNSCLDLQIDFVDGRVVTEII